MASAAEMGAAGTPPGETPVVVLSANRPDQLAAALRSLMRQDDAEIAGRPVFLFQDGGRSRFGGPPAWSDAVLLANLDCFRQLVPHGVPLPTYRHFGAALTRDRAERFVFEELTAPGAIVLDDAMVLGRRYLATLDQLICLALTDERIGYVAASGEPRANLAAQRANASRLIALRRVRGYGLVRRQWLKQRRYIADYLRAAGLHDRSGRDYVAIQTLFHAWGLEGSDTSLDAAVAHACALTGAARINTYACFARAMDPAPGDLPGFDGPEMDEDGVFQLVPPTAAELAAIMAARLD
jgi:hypothetical protein